MATGLCPLLYEFAEPIIRYLF